MIELNSDFHCNWHRNMGNSNLTAIEFERFVISIEKEEEKEE